MKLQEAPTAICKVVKFPASVTSYLRTEDCQNEQYYDLKGGLLKDTQYAWLSWGPNFEVIRSTNGAKVAAWTFGAALHHSKTKVTCVTELPCNDGSGRVSQFVVGLECELDGGMVCVFDIRGSKVLRAVQVPSKVTSLSVVDCGSEGCYPLPQLLSSMTGVLAVGLAGGQLMLVDLCQINYDEGLGTGNCGDMRDERHACELLPISVHETDQETLEYKRAHAARTGDHLCVVLNESFLADKMFLLPLPDSNTFSVPRRRIDVTALMYIPRIASIVAGFSFGSFQIWNLMHLNLEYMSPTMQDPLPVISFGFQEPCDDPRNFCYLWAVHSSSSYKNKLPCAVMYALCYQSKEWVDGYGYLNQDFVSCVHRFDFDLGGEDCGSAVVGGHIVACNTISKLSPSVTRRENPHTNFDESIQESDLTLCLFVWEAWGANCPGSTRMAVFDLNQWYKEQMPGKIVKEQVSTYMTIFSLDEVVEASASTANSTNPLLDVRVDPASLSQFTAVQSLEEHFYPSALAFESLCLLGEELVMVSHPGVQRDILSQLELTGPSALVYPNQLFHHCIAVGLKAVYVELSTTFNCPVTEQREFLMSIALEYQLVGFLTRCAAEWMDGSQSAMGCTLSALLKWGWQRAISLKTHADNLCVRLYDYSGLKLDTISYQLLDYCGNQLHHLTTLFQGVLKMCKNPIIQGVGDLSQQAQILELVAVYIEVVEWFVNVGLLPEFPCEDLILVDDGCETSDEFGPHRVPYPASTLTKIYQKRRAELEKLSRTAADKTDILFIDGLVKRECNGDRLSSLWERDGGIGLYPPPSIQSLLRTYLLDGIPMHVKHCIVIYVFLDLAGLLESHRYSAAINQFIKFPSAFRLTPSFIKITQALWLLDHQDYTEAIDMLLDPLVSMDDLKPWQHQCIIRAFLYQGQHKMALRYIRVQQPPLKDIEDIRLNLTVLLVNGLIHEAFQYQRRHCNEQNSRDLLQHFFSACQQMNQLNVVLQLALSPVEEEAFTYFLQNCHNPRADDMRVMYYLERSRIAEAMEVNNSICSSKGHVESNSLKRGRAEDRPSCVRDTIVQAYANTLPSVTRKLALYCAQKKSCLTNWKQVSPPTPMSVDVHRGELQPVRYRSSLIQATLEKARETWTPAVVCTPAKRDRSNMEKPSVERTPFLCTPRAAADTFSFTRDTTEVVFPTLMCPAPKYDDEITGGSPVKRFRYSDHYLSPLGSGIASSRKRLDRYCSVDALSLLQTPHVRRRTTFSASHLQEQQDIPSSPTTMFTPQSILKVRKMVRHSVSSENLSVPTDRDTSTTPRLLEEEEEAVEENMHVSDEEVLPGRQIRFSLPSEEQQDKNFTPEDSLLHPFIRFANKTSILDVTPRKALTSIRRRGSVRFDSSISGKEMLQVTGNKTVGLMDMELTSVVSTLPDRVFQDHESRSPQAADSALASYQSKEAPKIQQQDIQDNSKSEVRLLDSESVHMEDDTDVFHSLESSGNIVDSVNHSIVDNADVTRESLLKKQQVGNSNMQKEEVISAQVNPAELKEQLALHSRTWKLQSILQNSVKDDEPGAADTVEMEHEVEEQNRNFEVTERVVQEENDKNGQPVKIPEADVKEKEEVVAVTSAEEMTVEEKKISVGILLDTTAYNGSSFEISEAEEHVEEATAANITVSSSDGNVGELDVSEVSDAGLSSLPESGLEKLPAVVIESVTGNLETFKSSKGDQKEYQTLQPVVTESEYVLDEKEGSASDSSDVMDEHDEFPDSHSTRKKEHKVATDISMEESELEEGEILRPQIYALDIEEAEENSEEDEDIEEEEDEDEEDEDEEEEDLGDEEEDLDEEKEFEPAVHHPKLIMAKKPSSDEEGSIIILDSDSDEGKVEPCKRNSLEAEHIAGDLSHSDESESEDEEEVMEEEEEEDEEEEEEDEEEEENDETSSKFDSGSETEHVLDADGIATVEQLKLIVGIADSVDDMNEEDGSQQKSTEEVRGSAADVLESNELCVKEVIEKEPMDFESCIGINEISKYDQNEGKISELVDAPDIENNGGSRTLVVDQHMMDFEAEITASKISKQKPTKGRIDYDTQISVENQGNLNEMKVASVTVPETSETLTGDGEQGGEKFGLVLGENKQQVSKEKLIHRAGDTAVQLLCTESTSLSLEEDDVDITMKEEEPLPDRTVGAGTSDVTSQQVVQEVDATMCGVKARKTSENSSPYVDKHPSCIDLEERSKDVKPRKTSSRAVSVSGDIIHVDVNTETKDVNLSKVPEVTTEARDTVPVVYNKSCTQKREIHKGDVVTSLLQGGTTEKTESCVLVSDKLKNKAVRTDEADSNNKTDSKQHTKEQVLHHGLKTVDTDSHEGSIAHLSERDGVMQGDSEVISKKFCEKQTHESCIEAGSSHYNAVSNNEDTCERKVHLPSRKAECVLQQHVLHAKTEFIETKVCKLSSTAGSVLIKDGISEETEICEGKDLQHTIGPNAVECEDVPSDMTCERTVQKPSSRADSVECENDTSAGTEACEMKVFRSSSKFSSVQHESVQSCDTETHNKKVHKPSSTARSDQNENVPLDKTETCESKVPRSGSMASSVQPQDVVSDETEVCKRKVHKPSSRSSSVQSEDVPSRETEICERKVRKPSRRYSSVQSEDVPSGETEICERKVCKPGSRSSSVQPEDIPSDGTQICKRKVHKPSNRSSSVQPEDVSSGETEICKGKVRKPSRRSSSVQPEYIPSGEIEICERKVCKPIRRSSSVQPEDIRSGETETCERKVQKPSRRSSSVQPEYIPSGETEIFERKVCKPSSRSSSVQHEDVRSGETETCERKVRKPSRRYSSVQLEDVSSGETEICERKVRKSSRRSSSVQPEDICSGETEICERKVCKPIRRSSSVQPEDIRSCETEICERKVHKPSRRSSSVQPEDIRSGETEIFERKVHKPIRRSSSVQPEDVPSDETEACDRKVCSPSGRASFVQCEDDPVDETDEHGETVCKSSSRRGSVEQQVVISSETEPVAGRVCTPECRASSVQRNHLEVIVEEEPSHIECDKTGSSDCRDVILSADSAFNENRQPRASEDSDANTVILEENCPFAQCTKECDARSRHLSASSICTSVQNDEMDVDKIYSDKSHQSDSILDVVYERPEENIGSTSVKETEIDSTAIPEFGNMAGLSAKKCHTTSSEKVVDSFERKTKGKNKQAGSSYSNVGATTRTTLAVKSSDIEDSGTETEGNSVTKTIRESKGVTDRHKKSNAVGCVYDTGNVKLNVPPVTTAHDADVLMEMDDKKEKTEKAVPVFGLNNQGISGPSLLQHEMFRFISDADGKHFRKARSESQYSVGPVTESRRFTRSMSGMSTSTTTTDIGLVTDNNASPKKSQRSYVGQERTGHSLETLVLTHRESSCSKMSSEASVQWKRKACSTNRGDNSSVQQVMEEYATNRRLTRHQRSLLERSLELTMQPVCQLRQRKLSSLSETSDGEDETGGENKSSSQISGVGTRLSSRLRSQRSHNSPSPSMSQASTLHRSASEVSLHKAGRQSRQSQKTHSALNDDSVTDSSSSVKSYSSLPYASSARSAPSHLGVSVPSGLSGDVTVGRVRRRSFQQAQIALRSASEQGFVSSLASGSKPRASSPADSDSNMSSDAGSSHVSVASAGSHITRSVTRRMSLSHDSEGKVRCLPHLTGLKEEDSSSALSGTSFHFSPPTLVHGSARREESSISPASSVPEFVFSPPQKQQPLPKPHHQSAPSQQMRVHTMALRGLHTITEESTPPSTPTSTCPPQASERDTTPIAVKKSKRFKPTPSSKTPYTSR